MGDVHISFYVIFKETLSKWAYNFINYIGLVKESFEGVYVFLTMRVEILNLV